MAITRIISDTVRYYFDSVHNLKITSSKALEWMDMLKKFKEVHSNYESDFTKFRGVDYQTIHQVLDNGIKQLENVFNSYQEEGRYVTDSTNLYDIIELNIKNDNNDSSKLSSGVIKRLRDVVIDGTKIGLKEALSPAKSLNTSNKETIMTGMELKNLKKQTKK